MILLEVKILKICIIIIGTISYITEFMQDTANGS